MNSETLAQEIRIVVLESLVTCQMAYLGSLAESFGKTKSEIVTRKVIELSKASTLKTLANHPVFQHMDGREELIDEVFEKLFPE